MLAPMGDRSSLIQTRPFARGAIICGKRVERWRADTEDWLSRPLRWRKPRHVLIEGDRDVREFPDA